MLICGIDEVGRGPLAGDVYAAAVILPENHSINGIRDSKMLSEMKRTRLYAEITENATAWAVGTASVEEIRKLNIRQAVLIAMRRAVETLAVKPDMLLIDGNDAEGFSIPVKAVVQGDRTIECISAASIIAKVTRDLYMKELDRLYPGYGFAQNNGYGTVEHRKAIRRLGMCPAHRELFCRKTLLGASKAGVFQGNLL